MNKLMCSTTFHLHFIRLRCIFCSPFSGVKILIAFIVRLSLTLFKFQKFVFPFDRINSTDLMLLALVEKIVCLQAEWRFFFIIMYYYYSKRFARPQNEIVIIWRSKSLASHRRRCHRSRFARLLGVCRRRRRVRVPHFFPVCRHSCRVRVV